MKLFTLNLPKKKLINFAIFYNFFNLLSRITLYFNSKYIILKKKNSFKTNLNFLMSSNKTHEKKSKKERKRKGKLFSLTIYYYFKVTKGAKDYSLLLY